MYNDELDRFQQHQPVAAPNSSITNRLRPFQRRSRAVSDRTAAAEAHQLEVHDGEHSFAWRAEELFDTLASEDAVDSEVLVIVILEAIPVHASICQDILQHHS